MSRKRFVRRCLSMLPLLAATACGAGESRQLPLDTIKLPSGFSIEVAVADIPNARSMTLGDDGTLFVGTRGEGALYAVTGWDDGDARVHVLATDMNMPNGVAFRDGALYVAEVDRILRYDDIEARLTDPGEPELIARYPSDRHHGWKYIAFGPDDRLYVPIGAPCNICNEEGYAVITSIEPDGSDRRVYAEGVRNTVGFTWHPETGELWFTDNGRDHLGNDVPPCELNHAPRPGLHFGYPYCHGRDVADPEFGDQADCEDFVPPAAELGPHVAPLGVKFYTGDRFPEDYRGQVFIAEHGSWNRDTPIGYRVTLVRLDGDRASSYQTFASGWLQDDGEAWGRPVDLLQTPDGDFLLSDDHAGVIYRIRYTGAGAPDEE